MEAPAEPSVVSLSSTGHDRFFGVAYAKDGSFYATGQIASTIDADADYALLVAKFKRNGERDTSSATTAWP